jgi:hypothetical protein
MEKALTEIVDKTDIQFHQKQESDKHVHVVVDDDDDVHEHDIDDDDVLLNEELRNIWLRDDDDDDDDETQTLNTKLCRELMLLRSKSKIPKKHVNDVLQLIHRCCELTPRQKRFIPPDFSHVDKMYKLSRAAYVKVRTSTRAHTRAHVPKHVHIRYLCVLCLCRWICVHASNACIVDHTRTQRFVARFSPTVSSARNRGTSKTRSSTKSTVSPQTNARLSRYIATSQSHSGSSSSSLIASTHTCFVTLTPLVQI